MSKPAFDLPGRAGLYRRESLRVSADSGRPAMAGRQEPFSGTLRPRHRFDRALYTEPTAMTFARVSLSLAGVVGLVAVALAAATIWLLVSQPVTTADAAADLARGNVTPLARALAGVLYDALQGLLRYL